MHIVSVCLHSGNIIWLPWQRPLTNWKISIDPSSAHKVLSYGENIAKISPTMSADIQRNTPVFWPCRTWRSEKSSIISGVTRQKFTKFLHDIATSSPLLVRTYRQWYCNSFLNSSAKNASGISQRSWHFPKINWLPWQLPLTNWKTRYRYVICNQSAFIWWKDCKNRSTISWYIWLNMPVFAMS